MAVRTVGSGSEIRMRHDGKSKGPRFPAGCEAATTAKLVKDMASSFSRYALFTLYIISSW